MQVYDNEGRLIESDNGMWQEYRTYSDTERTEKQYWSGLDYTKLTVRKLNGNGDVIEVRTYKADGFTDCTEEDLQEYIVYTRDGEAVRKDIPPMLPMALSQEPVLMTMRQMDIATMLSFSMETAIKPAVPIIGTARFRR